MSGWRFLLKRNAIIGYSHYGRVGIRSHNLLISLSECANHVVNEIGAKVELITLKSSVKSLDTQALEEFKNITLPALVGHPHTASVMLVGAGCESVSASEVVFGLLAINPDVEYLVVDEGLDEEFAIALGANGATDLITRALPGFGELVNPHVIIDYCEAPKILAELTGVLEELGFDISLRPRGGLDAQVLRNWMLEGALVILSFTPPSRYPVGTVLTPVINISSDSEFHKTFAGDFDLLGSDTVESVVEEVLGVFSRVRTFSEYTKTVLPVDYSMVPRLALGSSSEKLISIVTLNSALNNLATDLEKNFASTKFLGSWGNQSEITGKGFVLALGTGSDDELNRESQLPINSRIIHLSERGSLAALAQSAAEIISSLK